MSQQFVPPPPPTPGQTRPLVQQRKRPLLGFNSTRTPRLNTNNQENNNNTTINDTTNLNISNNVNNRNINNSSSMMRLVIKEFFKLFFFLQV